MSNITNATTTATTVYVIMNGATVSLERILSFFFASLAAMCVSSVFCSIMCIKELRTPMMKVIAMLCLAHFLDHFWVALEQVLLVSIGKIPAELCTGMCYMCGIGDMLVLGFINHFNLAATLFWDVLYVLVNMYIVLE